MSPQMSPQKQLRDVQILNFCLRGMKLKQIAKHMQLHRNTITQILKRPEIQQLLQAMEKDLVEQATRDMLARQKMLGQTLEAKRAYKRASRY